jgi:TetR/AcrR family transcriptional repressor of nem operon
MRYSAEHKQQTRERVLKEAARAIRAEGVDNLGVASIMAKVGLTHGGFYAHFANREALVAAAIEEMFRQGGARLEQSMQGRSPAEGLAHYLDFYLSTGHRDSRTAGCPLPFLSADAPRLAEPMRRQYAGGAHALTRHLTSGFCGPWGTPTPTTWPDRCWPKWSARSAWRGPNPTRPARRPSWRAPAHPSKPVLAWRP